MVGCGPTSDKGELKGTITYKGQPVNAAGILLYPSADKDAVFDLRSCQPERRVRQRRCAAGQLPNRRQAANGAQREHEARRQLVSGRRATATIPFPDKYKDVKTTDLTCTVKAGDQTPCQAGVERLTPSERRLIMTSTDISPPAAPRRVRRRRLWLVLAWSGLLLAAGFLAVEGWALWQERSARQAMADEHFDDAQKLIDPALLVRESFASTHLLAARIARLRGAYSEAERHLSRCEQLGGMSDQLQLEWLLLRCQQGEVDELAPGLLAAVDHNHPESVAILEALAAVYMRQLRYVEARAMSGSLDRAGARFRARPRLAQLGVQSVTITASKPSAIVNGP